PLLLKDVAGLVPGAYQGRGHGNAFLNDLNDADVLVHVVDASGALDRNGVAAEGTGDPVDDVTWVRYEIHRWVYNNVVAKWGSIYRNPEKLLDMFSGYHSSKVLVRAALRRAGIDPGLLGDPSTGVHTWKPEFVHRLVAHFLRQELALGGELCGRGGGRDGEQQ
ncbi:hypothetical protein CYMTET_23687, partial [Cymbomonas tetramitiformis]